jgi:hypothetical protein
VSISVANSLTVVSIIVNGHATRDLVNHAPKKSRSLVSVARKQRQWLAGLSKRDVRIFVENYLIVASIIVREDVMMDLAILVPGTL